MSKHFVVDRETAFKKWVEFGTQQSVIDWLAKNGKVNSKGRPVSKAAVSYAARRWVCEHPEEARKYYQRYGQFFDDDIWHEWLVHTAIKVFHSHGRKPIEDLLDRIDKRDEYGYLIGETSKS